MPELAEVAYACSLWHGGLGKKVKAVHIHPTSRVFRDEDRDQFRVKLTAKTLKRSETHGKQMLFTFSGDYWLGLHLGMTGWLHSEEVDYSPKNMMHSFYPKLNRNWFSGSQAIWTLTHAPR